MPYLLFTNVENGIVPSHAAACALKAVKMLFLTFRNASLPDILPDKSLMAMQAEKLNRNPVLAAQNGSAAIMIRAAADIAETVSLPANAVEDINTALVTDSLHPVTQAIINDKIT